MTQPLSYGLQSSHDHYYRHSNRVTAPGLLFGALAGLAIAVGLSFVYAYAVRYILVIPLNPLFSLAYGAAMGLGISFVMHRFKVRSLPITLALVAPIAALGFYLSWCVWISSRFAYHPGAPSVMDLVFNPALLVRIIRELYAVGTWRLPHAAENLTGPPLAGVWVGEGLLILGAALAAARLRISDRPFCERCNRWCEKDIERPVGPCPNEADFRRRLEAGDMDVLEELPAANTASGSWMTLTLHACLECGQLHTLTVTRCTRLPTAHPSSNPHRRTLLNKLLLDPPSAHLARMRRHLPPLPPKPPDRP